MRRYFIPLLQVSAIAIAFSIQLNNFVLFFLKFPAEDAKCKWRSLIGYLRQHLDCVAQKKLRRYIPTTGNPDDKYVQLTDWVFYKELEFIVPYVKYAASKQSDNNYGNRIDPTTNEMDIIINSLEDYQEEEKVADNTQEKVAAETVNNVTFSKGLDNADNEEETAVPILTEEEEILKEFFDNMLKSTISLPRFHQNRIKKKLMHVINEQKEK